MTWLSSALRVKEDENMRGEELLVKMDLWLSLGSKEMVMVWWLSDYFSISGWGTEPGASGEYMISNMMNS